MKGVKKFMKGTISVLLVSTGLVCAAVRLSQTGISPSLGLAAAEITMPAGNVDYLQYESSVHGSYQEENTISAAENEASHIEEASAENNPALSASGETDSGFEASSATAEELEAYRQEHQGEKSYPVNEFNTTKGNTSYKNVQVKNSSSIKLDIAAELDMPLGFIPERTSQPQVLIYHTHTSESYLRYDTGYFYESYYPRSSDKNENVCAVGEEITKQLNAAGIVTIHDTTVHDDPSYSGAYDRSMNTIMSYLERYPTIKVVIDIHRDGIGTDTQKSKPVFTVDGKKAAQVMILAGYNADDSEEFRNWEDNLRFALKIQDAASKEYPEMMRPLYFNDFMYNMNANSGSLLIEVGSESNTVEEARLSGCLLGKILAQVLLQNTQ